MHRVPRIIRLVQARCLIGYKVQNFCTQHNINVITAPANDHRAIGLVERLIQIIKGRLGCMKLDSRNNTFTIKEAIKSIVYQFSIRKQKTNVSPFLAHFGRKPNTPLSNISTIANSSYLSYENILQHYLYADTVPVEDYLDDNGLVTRDCSDILKEEAMQKTQVDAGRRYNGDRNKSVSRFIMHPKLNNPMARSQKSLDFKLARKVSKRPKRDLRGLWKTLAPGITVVRTSPTTTVIKDPESLKSECETMISQNSVPALSVIGTFGNTPSDVPYHMRRQKKRREPSIQTTLKRNIVGRPEFVTGPPSQMLLQEFRLPTATFLRPCLLVNPKNHKWEEIDRHNPLPR